MKQKKISENKYFFHNAKVQNIFIQKNISIKIFINIHVFLFVYIKTYLFTCMVINIFYILITTFSII